MMKRVIAGLVVAAGVAVVAAGCASPVTGTVTDKYHEDAYMEQECSIDPDGRDKGELECEDVEVPECWGLIVEDDHGVTHEVCTSGKKEYDSYDSGDHYPKEDTEQ